MNGEQYIKSLLEDDKEYTIIYTGKTWLKLSFYMIVIKYNAYWICKKYQESIVYYLH